MVKKFTRKQKSEIAGSWGMKVSEVDWDFVEQYGETGTVRRLTDEINKANNLKEIDKKLSEVIQGKHKRKGCTIVGKSNGRNVVIAETRHKSLWD